jgi:hypothetical protein
MRNAHSSENATALLVAVGLVVVLLFWLPLLLMGLLVGMITLVVKGIEAQRLARLRGLIRRAEQRYRGDVCRSGIGFARLAAVGVERSASGLQLRLALERIGAVSLAQAADSAAADPPGAEPPAAEVPAACPPQGGPSEGGQPEPEALALQREVRFLAPPADLSTLESNLGFSRWLESQGITMLSDLAVEAKATQAALTCLEEADWARRSLATIETLIRSAQDTLAKARGNELLEPAIPQLQQALASFEGEQVKLCDHLRQANTRLRKLHDFLSVPEALRPILTFDLNGLFDPARLQALKDSFAEVVVLNDTFLALSRQR